MTDPMTTDAIRILLVEDNPLEARRIRRSLEALATPQFSVVRAGTLRDGIDLIRSERFDAVLLDLILPDSSDLRTVRHMLAHAGESPIIVLTNLEDPRTALAAVREGAQDYLFKTKLDGEVLSRTIRHAMERHDLSRRLRASEELWRRAVSRAPDAIWRGTLADQLITYVNEAACRILRAESDELLGAPLDGPPRPR